MDYLLRAIKGISDNQKESICPSIFFVAIFVFVALQPLFGTLLESDEPLTMKVEKHYSLWLVPKGERREFYQKLIEDLGCKHRGPIFVPHITVIGNIPLTEEEILLRAQQLAQLLHPLSVTLNEVSTGDVFYRCVFAKAEKSQSLMQLYTQACQAFDITPGDFMPHLSLLYGDYDKSLKKKIATHIEIHDTLYLDSLFIYETSPNLKPQDWRFVARIPFR